MTEEQIKNIKEIRDAYRQAFGSESGQKVLKDLEQRCYKRHTTYAGDTDTTLINEGKRQVLLTIENMMTLDVDELIEEES